MPYRRKRTLRLKTNEQHSGTKMHTIGPGTVTIAEHVIRTTEAGNRDTAGGDASIQSLRTLDDTCQIGDICKFVNIFIQAGPRIESALQSAGWVEWAVVKQRELDTDPVNTNLGTQTLGDVCTKYFRNECIYTGNVPVGATQTNSQNITIKIPPKFQRLTMGDQLKLYLYARTADATETGTGTFRVVTSYMYKNYH